MLATSGDTLGWRDVKEILAGTARQINPGDPDWVTNGGGFRFNHKYGGGMIDLRAAVTRAITWNNLGTEVSQTIAVPAKQVPVNIPDGPVGMVTKTFNFSALPNLRLEQIEVVVDITHPRRSDLTITITSPGGIVSVLAKQHPHPDIVVTDDDDQNYKDNGLGWTFTSTHYWGDNSIKGTNGIWTLTIKDEGVANAFTGILNAAAVRLWGTVAPQSRVIFDGASYSLSESQVPDPQNPGQFINARQTIRIKRLGPLDSEATVDYATTVGTATFPGNQGGLPPDFTPVAGTAHFSQGQAFADANISVEILPDNEPEPSEQINLVLNNPIGASLGGVTLATIDILDSSQNSVSIAATDNTASETNVDVPVDWATFTISRLTATATPLTVHFNVTGTATFNDGVALEPDYQPIAVEATIPAFATSVNLVIRPLNDQAIEGVETVIISLESDPAYAIGAVSSAQINIVDNDRQKVQLVNLDNQADEINPANTGHLRLIRSVDISAANAFDKPLSVDLSLAGTQHPRDNYTLIVGSEMRPLGPETTAFTVEIPAGLTTLDFFIVPVDDSVYEATKTVVVGLRPNPNYDSSFGFLTSSIVRIVEDDPLPDTAIPKVRITSPTDGQRFLRTDPFTLTASGTARDNTNVQRVFVRVNDRPAQLATLATPDPTKPNIVTWSLNITSELMLGKNVMTVQARDGDLNNFNDSALETVRFTYIERHNLTVNIDGAGDVTPAYRGTTLQKAGDTLKIVATPAPGNVFAGWFSDTPVPNTLISPSRKLLFMMPANPTGDATLRAKFITSPFTEQIAGNYSGLVQAPIFNFDTSGFLAVKVSGTGAFSGKLNFAGKVLPLIGEFTVGNGGNATYSGLVQRGNNLAPLALGLTIDTNPNGTQRITGTVNSGPVSSEVAADRAAYGKTVPAPSTLTHDYTIYMPPAAPLADPSKDPHGMGVGTVKIDARGVVRWKGRLADRTVVSQTASLTKANTWPLFLSLYERKGIMLGTVTHEGVQPPNNLTAIVDWFRPIIGKGNFPLGFKIVDARVFGAIYNAPDADSRVLSSFDTAPDNKGTITIDEGNILSPVSAQFLLNLKNKVKFDLPNPRAIEIVIDPVTGKFTGSFIHPISLKKTAMEGIVFQTLTGPDQQMIGTFLGKSQSGVPNQTGRIFLKANTAVGP